MPPPPTSEREKCGDPQTGGGGPWISSPEEEEMTQEPDDVLRSEHELIETLLFAVDGIAARVGSEEPFPREDVKKAMVVMVEFVDQCHHAKEERFLFPALSENSPGKTKELTRRVSSDRRAFRRLVAQMRTHLPTAEADRRARRRLANELALYSRLVHNHVRIEEERILPEADRILGSAARRRMTARFERLEADERDAGRHARHQAMIRELAQAYATYVPGGINNPA